MMCGKRMYFDLQLSLHSWCHIQHRTRLFPGPFSHKAHAGHPLLLAGTIPAHPVGPAAMDTSFHWGSLNCFAQKDFQQSRRPKPARPSGPPLINVPSSSSQRRTTNGRQSPVKSLCFVHFGFGVASRKTVRFQCCQIHLTRH